MRDLEKEFGHLFKTAELEKEAFWGMLGSWGKTFGSKALGWGKTIGDKAMDAGQKMKGQFTGALDEGRAGFRLARSAAGAGNQTAFNRGMDSMLKGFGTAGLMGGAGLIGVNAVGNAIWGGPEMPKTASLQGVKMFGKYLGHQAKTHIPELAGTGLLGGAGIYLGNTIHKNAIPEVDLLPYLEARKKIGPVSNTPEAE